MQPLRRDEQLDAAAAGVGHGERRLEAEERLVLHADLVVALDDHVADDVWSPRTIRWWRMTLPSGWIGGCVPSIAASGSVSGSSTSYSTTIAASARRHVSGWSAGDRGDRLADVAHEVARRTPAGPR